MKNIRSVIKWYLQSKKWEKVKAGIDYEKEIQKYRKRYKNDKNF